MIKVGIIGGSRPEAGELLRILINHPDVEIDWIHDPAHKGLPVDQYHRGLVGETFLRFTDEMDFSSVNLIFMCHDREGMSRRILTSASIPEDLRIIDLSPDFINDPGFVYGLPESNRKPLVRGARRAAVPSAIAMPILLALLPLAKNLMLNSPIHATVIRASHPYDLGLLSVFPGREEDEIITALTQLQSSFAQPVNIISVHGGFNRGMMAVVYLESPISLDQVREIYENYYDDHSFTFISDNTPDIREIANTNKCMLNIEKYDGRLVITSIVDDMLKGSAGNAVHLMNLLFGLQERVGLMLKASGR